MAVLQLPLSSNKKSNLFVFVFTFLISNSAGSFAGGLAGCLTFAAAAFNSGFF
jgi:hypothetical protein